jgi:hypothetical protein
MNQDNEMRVFDGALRAATCRGFVLEPAGKLRAAHEHIR